MLSFKTYLQNLKEKGVFQWFTLVVWGDWDQNIDSFQLVIQNISEEWGIWGLDAMMCWVGEKHEFSEKWGIVQIEKRENIKESIVSAVRLAPAYIIIPAYSFDTESFHYLYQALITWSCRILLWVSSKDVTEIQNFMKEEKISQSLLDGIFSEII